MKKYTMVMIEPVRSCPVKCVPCPVGREDMNHHPAAVMDLNLAMRCFKKLRDDFQATYLMMGNWGEPLLHPQFPEMVQIAKDEGFEHVYVTTSLSVDRDMTEIAISGLNTIHVSISGITEEIYHRSHRKGDFELVMRNLNSLAAAIKTLENPPEVVVRWHRYRYNEFQLEVAEEYCQKIGIKFLPYFAHAGAFEALRDYDRNCLEEPLRTFVAESVFTDFVEQACHLNGHMKQCGQSDFLVIDADGSLLFCCSCYKNYKLSAPFLTMSPEEIELFKIPDSPVCTECLAKGWSGYLLRRKTLEEYEGKIKLDMRRKD